MATRTTNDEQSPNPIGAVVDDVAWRTFVDNAREHGPWPLSADQWAVVRFVLTFHRVNGQAPALVRVARSTGLTSRALYDLFPFGVVRTILQLAGLPLPAELLGCCPLPSRGSTPPALH